MIAESAGSREASAGRGTRRLRSDAPAGIVKGDAKNVKRLVSLTETP
jgi:hypothetical protein